MQYKFNKLIARLIVSSMALQMIEPIEITYANERSTENLFQNNGFEEQLKNWGTWIKDSNLTISADSKEFKEGTNSLKFENTSGIQTSGKFYQTFNVEKFRGKTIKLSQWVKGKSFQGSFQVRAQLLDANGQKIGEYDIKEVFPNDVWELKELRFDIPNNNNIKNLQIDFIYNNSKGDLWVDDIRTSIEDTIKTNNLIKNSSFEEDFSYWSTWKANDSLEMSIDSSQYKEGKKSALINNNQSQNIRGILGQKISLQNYQGKAIKVSQWVKSSNLSGKVELRIKFLNKNNDVVGNIDTKSISLDSNSEWSLKEYTIDIPDSNEITNVDVDYIYEAKGKLWVDNINVELIDKVETNNLIKNSSFEEDFSYWSTWKANDSLEMSIDSSQYKEGKKSALINNNQSQNIRGILGQKISLQNYQGKAIKVSQWVKSSNLSGKVELRIKFLNKNNDVVGNIDTKSISLDSNSEWSLKEYTIDIPDSNEITNVDVDYIYEAKGKLWVDNINVELIDKVETNNLIKNSSFEEDFSYWNTWKANDLIKFELDKNIKKDGNTSLKVDVKSSEASRGILSQKISIDKSLQGKVLNIKQWIKTQKLLGEVIQVRVKFLDNKDQEIISNQIQALDITENCDWTEVQGHIFLPENLEVNSLEVEYIFEKITGTIWLDKIDLYEEKNKVQRNIVNNGSFESTIKKPVTSWYLRDDSNASNYAVDSQNKIDGNQSIRIFGNEVTNNPKISQTIKIEEGFLGKNIKISEYIKSSDKNYINKKIKYLNENGEEILKADEFRIDLSNGWQKYEQIIEVPNDNRIKSIELEYYSKNIKGNIWIDNVRVEPFIATKNITLSTEIFKIAKGETKDLVINTEPVNTSHKDFKITVDNTNIATVNNNKLTGINPGITKIIITQEYENKTWEFPVVVNGNDEIKVDSNVDIKAIQGECIEGTVNIKNQNNNGYVFSTVIEGNAGYIDLEKDGKFKYYLKEDFIGKDKFILKVEDNKGNFNIIQYNITVNKKALDFSEYNFSITLTENNKIEDKLDIKYNSKLKYSIKENATNGKFSIDENGYYSYTPNKNYYGYDSAVIQVQTITGETSNIEVAIYVSPSKETMLKKINKSNPRLLVNMDRFKEIKKLIDSDDLAKEWFKIIKNEADSILTSPVIPYETDDGLRLNTLSIEYVEKLSFMYRVTNDKKYAERAWLELENICKYPDWNENHFLNTAGMAIAVAMGYDWLNDYLNSNQKNILKNAIIEKALNKALVHYNNNDGFTVMTNNWNIVCNAGMIFSSLAIADSSNANLTLNIVENALKSIQTSLATYYSDGSSFEGPAYWDYATEYLVYAISSIENVLEIKNPFEGAIDLNKLANYAIYINGNKGSFNYADSKTEAIQSYYGLWFAKELNEPKYTQATKSSYNNTKNVSVYNFLWYNPKTYNKDLTTNLDRYFDTSEIVTMRSGFISNNSTFVGIKGGTTGVEHGDLDIGTFVYDALGVRWALDLGLENYNLPGYWDQGIWGERWNYYRKRAEGHNTLIIGQSSNEDQVVGTTSKIIKSELNTANPFAVLDMTPAYSDKALKVNRKIQLNNDRKNLIIEDEFLLKKSEEVIWQMHTDAEIQILDNGKALLLKKDGQELKMLINSSENIKFEVVSAKPSSNSPNPNGQTENVGIKKIIAKTNVKKGNIKVEMIPMGDHNSIASRVLNGSFEDGLRNWNKWTPVDNFNIELDNKIKKAGNYSVKISNSGGKESRGTLSQTIDLSNYYGNSIKISQFIKSENLTRDLIARVTYFNSKGEQIGEKHSISIFGKGTHDWRQVETEFNLPNNTKKMMIEFLYDSCTGSVWLDDVKHVLEKEDINEDGIIDILDLAVIANKYNQVRGESNWYEKYDINNDGAIDIYDLIHISSKM